MQEREAKAPPLHVAREREGSGIGRSWPSLEDVRSRMGSKVHVVLPPEPHRTKDVVEGPESAASMLDRAGIAIGYVAFPYLQSPKSGRGCHGEEFHPHFVLVATISKTALQSLVSSCVRSCPALLTAAAPLVTHHAPAPTCTDSQASEAFTSDGDYAAPVKSASRGSAGPGEWAI
jgi:hypothetical protein